jgi:hypothetical protein
MNDKDLTRFRKSPRPEFADALYQRISEPMTARSLKRHVFPARRAVLALGLLLLTLLFTFALSPTTRAIANEQIRQIGALIFREAGDESSLAAKPTVPAPSPADAPERVALVQDAARLAGFEVRALRYLPASYAQEGGWSVDRQESGVYVVSTYRDSGSNHFLILNQTRYTAGTEFEQVYADNEQVSEVTVAGQKAIWISGRLMSDPEDANTGPAGRPALQPTNWLVWQEGEIVYTLFGNGLTQDEMMQVADSLAS